MYTYNDYRAIDLGRKKNQCVAAIQNDMTRVFLHQQLKPIYLIYLL